MAYALVTGASSGIGLRSAIALARDYKYNILLVSNQEKELEVAAESISSQFGVQTETLYLNLAAQNAAFYSLSSPQSSVITFFDTIL